MIAYLDTSAIVKLLIDEAGSPVAVDIWNLAEERVTAVITYAETRAALASARRSGRLRTQALERAKRELESRWLQLARIRVEHPIVRAAGDLAQDHALRGYDALHLATAQAAGESGTILLVTWDVALSRAARKVGLAVAPPIA